MVTIKKIIEKFAGSTLHLLYFYQNQVHIVPYDIDNRRGRYSGQKSETHKGAAETVYCKLIIFSG